MKVYVVTIWHDSMSRQGEVEKIFTTKQAANRYIKTRYKEAEEKSVDDEEWMDANWAVESHKLEE